jgi:hypothetical protein
MDQDTIQKIAQEVAKHLPNYSWQLLAAQVMFMIFAFGGGIFCGVHLRTRAKNAAFKDDLSVQPQLRSNMVETIREEIRQEDWINREWANLRRMKLETLLTKVHDCEHFLDQLHNATLKDHRDPMPELEVVTTLYFPELKIEVEAYLDQCRAKRISVSEPSSQAGKLDALLLSTQKIGPHVNQTEFEAARDRLSTAARNLTTQIMGVGQ